MQQQPPRTVTAADRLSLVLVLAGLVVTVLVVVFSDELQRAWSRGEPADSAIQPLAFVPVAVVLYVTIAVIVLVLRVFLVRGHNWARHSLAALVLGIGFATLAGLRSAPPALFQGCAAASIVLDVALLVCLWHPATSRFVRAHHDRDPAHSAAD